jgi:UDP-galactopyranose mutase
MRNISLENSRYERYAERASEKNVTFAGPLVTYRYYNMGQVIGMALEEFDRIFKLC